MVSFKSFDERGVLFFFTLFLLVTFGLFGQVTKPSTPPASEQIQMIQKIEKMTQIHYLNESRRSPFDTTQLLGDKVYLKVWRHLPPDPSAERTECLGYQWLLTGRGQKMGLGAPAIFAEFSSIKEVILELSDIQAKLERDDGRGKYKKAPEKKVYLTMTAERERVGTKNIDREKMKSLNECLKIGREYITKREVKL